MNEIGARILGYSFIGFFAGIYLFFKGFRLLWRKRLIENIPTSKVRSIAMGLVELEGYAIPDVILTAPYTKTPCVFYHIIIERLVRHKNSSSWVKEFEMKTDIPFFIKDDTGCVVLDPRGVETDLSLRYVNVEYDKRYKEYNIIEKEPIYVLGTAMRTDSTEEKIHKEVEARIKEAIENPEMKEGFDLNKDMWIDEKEWETAREEIRKKVSEEFVSVDEGTGKSSQFVPEYLKNVIIGKGEMDKNFILSNKSEKELVDNYKYKVFFCVFGGVALTLACLGIILSNTVFKGR